MSTIVNIGTTKIKYKKIDHPMWKYGLVEDYTICLKESISDISTEYYDLTRELTYFPDTQLTIKTGYAWDSVTAPKGFKKLLDRPKFRRAALVHDVLLQVIYDDKLLGERWLSFSHKVFRDILKKDCGIFTANIMYTGLVVGHNLWHKLTSK